MLKKITAEAALNAEMDHHLGYENTKNPRHPIVVTAKAVSASRPKMANLIWIRLVIVKVLLSPSSLKTSISLHLH